MAKSVFSKIIDRELPATILFEDKDFIVIDNIDHKAPVHILVIPKKAYVSLEGVSKSDKDFHANLLLLCRKMAKKLKIADNYKIHLNVGAKVQQVQHLHVHILGGWENAGKTKELI